MVRYALVHREGLDDMATVVEKTAEGSFATGILTIKRKVSTLSDLKKIRVSSFITGDAVFVTEENKNYLWIGSSKAAVDDNTVFLPNSYDKAIAPIGRWIIEKTISVSSLAQIDTDQVATLQTLVLEKTTIEDLKKARVGGRKKGDGIRVTKLDKVFVWITNSTLKIDDTNVILPNS